MAVRCPTKASQETLINIIIQQTIPIEGSHPAVFAPIEPTCALVLSRRRDPYMRRSGGSLDLDKQKLVASIWGVGCVYRMVDVNRWLGQALSRM